MAKSSSETHRTSDEFGNKYYETRIVDRDGKVYDGKGTNSEQSQQRASDKKDDGKPTWQPGWW